MKGRLSLTSTLVTAEEFYSLQGEGPTMGVPSIFLRLGGCNLLCDFKGPDGKGNPCDTIPVWQAGKPEFFSDILDRWEKLGWIGLLGEGYTHLVLTGGEPTQQQAPLAVFLDEMQQRVYGEAPYIEIETNGTNIIGNPLSQHLAQINCSPKLASSSMPRGKRYNEAALQQLARDSRAIFKFVITSKEDLHEVTADFVDHFRIPRQRVYLMPEGVNEQDLSEKRRWLAEICKSYRFNYSDRLQVLIWGEVTGV